MKCNLEKYDIHTNIACDPGFDLASKILPHWSASGALFTILLSAACSLDLDFELDHKKQPHSDEIFQLFSLCFSGTGLNHPS